MSLVELDLTGHVAMVQLNDPGKRNALTESMVTELIATFGAIEAATGVRAVVLSAAGPAFCAGADRNLLQGTATEPADAATRLEAIYEGFLCVARCPLPTIAAVNGPAVGAGMNLALACDVRLAGPDASFDPRFVQLGLHPGGGHTWLLQRIASPQTAAAAVLFGETLDAQAAWRCGVVFAVVPEDQLLARARAMADRAAEADRDLLSRVKTTLAEIPSQGTLDGAVQRELGDQVWSITRKGALDRLEGTSGT